MKTYLKFWKNAFAFKGRSTRAEYWVPFTVNVAAVVGLLVASFTPSNYSDAADIAARFLVFFCFIPSVAVTVRRLHDCDLPGTWVLLMVIGVGHLALWIMSMRQGTHGDNAYGPDPRQAVPDGMQKPSAIATTLALALAIAGSSAPVRATGQQDLPTAERRYLPVAAERICNTGTLLGFSLGKEALKMAKGPGDLFECHGEFPVGALSYGFGASGRDATWADVATVFIAIPNGTPRPKSPDPLLYALDAIFTSSGRTADLVAHAQASRYADFSHDAPGLSSTGETKVLDQGTVYRVLVRFTSR